MLKRESFSLIELMISLSLVIAIVTVTIPRFDFFNNYLLLHELDKLFVTFCYLQQRSIASNTKCFVTFDQADNSYACYSESYSQGYPQGSTHMTEIFSAKLSSKIRFGFIDGVMGPPGDPTKKIEKPIDLEININNSDRNDFNKIGFWPDGRVTRGTVYLVDLANKTMGALTCSVSQVSYIRKYKYENSQWRNLEK